jgi:hypothetical protein
MGFKSKAVSSQGSQIAIESGSGTSKTITGATKANPVVVTATAHGLQDGAVVAIAAVGGMTELNGNSYVIGNVTTNTFELIGIDGTSFGTYTTGGTATPKIFTGACEIKTFNGFDGQASEIDVTTICSEAKEFRPGLQDFGAFNFSMNYVPTDAAQVEMQDAKAAGVPVWFVLTLPQDLGQWVFLAFVRQMSLAGGVDTVLSSDVVLRITGAPTFIAAA